MTLLSLVGLRAKLLYFCVHSIFVVIVSLLLLICIFVITFVIVIQHYMFCLRQLVHFSFSCV